MDVSIKDIDSYLALQKEDQRQILEHLRQLIKSIMPKAEEVISYGMPAFKLQGTVVVGFAAFKNHSSFFPWDSKTTELFKEELKDYSLSKGTIRFTADKPLPDDLIKRIVEARIKANELKRLAKAKV